MPRSPLIDDRRPDVDRPSPVPVPEYRPASQEIPSGVVAEVAPARSESPSIGFTFGNLLRLAVALGVSLGLGFAIATRSGSLIHNRMLPWILGRSLGVAAYLTLAALVALGIWLRHPWRTRLWSPPTESLLRAHVMLAACTIGLLGGHLTSIALDKYAGVGWRGAFVPWDARYRPTGVALGTLALYGIVLVAGTASLAGFVGRKVWFPIHTVSAVVLSLCLVHGVLAGSDSHALRWMYVGTGAAVVLLQISRWAARYVRRSRELDLL